MIQKKPRSERIAAIRKRINPDLSDALKEKMKGMDHEGRIMAVLLERPELLSDPVWRIGNLYFCSTDDVNEPVVQFVPKDPQCLLLYDLFVDKWRRHCVLKARRIGFSTLICILGADHVFFNRDTMFNMVSLDEGKAQELLDGKIKFAYDKFPKFLRDELPHADGKNNNSEFMFGKNWGMRSKVRFRSGTSHVLHVSEWGITAHEDKKKSNEIKTGTLPTARHANAMVFLESTVKGGEQGDYWRMWVDAESVTEETRHEKSYNAFFCPWFWDPVNRLQVPNPDLIRQSTRDYVLELQEYWKERGWAEEDYLIDDEQAYWWQVEADTQGADMNQEYPGTPAEAFKAPVDGAVYANQLVQLEREGQITNFRYNESLPTFAAIDYGWGDGNSVIVFQVDGTRVDIIWHHEAVQKDEQYFVNKVAAAGFTPIRWALPWDTWQEANGVLNPNCVAARYIRAGAIGCFPIPRGSKRQRVERGKALLRRCRFLKHQTEQLVLSMMGYSWPADREQPVHDKNSHGADSYGYLAEAESLGYFKMGSSHNRMAWERQQMKKDKFAERRESPYVYTKC
jgi:hypothetical protein